jgi:O-antigen/teichoic acid export membrane protein
MNFRPDRFTSGRAVKISTAELRFTARIQIAIAVIPLEYLTALFGMSYVARGLERPVLTCVAGSAALNIAANLILIPHFGMMGAAYATIVSYTALLVAFILWFEKGPLRVSLRSNSESVRT